MAAPAHGSPRTGPGPSRRLLFSQLARSQSPLGRLAVVAWSLASVGLVGLVVLFDVAQFLYGGHGPEALGLSVFAGALLWLLAIVEGSELAVARLLATDPEVLRRHSARHTLERVQRDPKTFFNGRQALVVTSIVALTLAVAQIGKLHRPIGAGRGLVDGLETWPVQALLLFGFPNFIVLWVSQLYPKLRAAADAPGRFSLTSYQGVIRACMWLEERTRLGAPTTVLGILRDRVLLTGVAEEAVAMRPDPAPGEADGGRGAHIGEAAVSPPAGG